MTDRCRILSILVLAASASIAAAQENIWVPRGPFLGTINDVAIDDSAAYAGTLNGVFRSHDRGETWQQSGLAGFRVDQVEARPGSPVVLAVGYPSSDFWNQTLYVSRDGGSTWTTASLRHGEISVGTVVAVIDARELSTVYAWSGGMSPQPTFWKSVDAGASWQAASVPPPGGYGLPRALVSDSRAVFILHDAGDLSRSWDGGESWASVETTSGGLDSLAAGVTPGVLYGTNLGSFCRSADSGDTWTCSPGSYIPWILEVPGGGEQDSLLFASGGDRVLVSRDAGTTWERASEGFEGHFQALACDETGSLLLAATNDGVLRSEDRGETWARFRSGFQSAWISTLAIDPRRPHTLWAGVEDYSSDDALFRSDDAGQSWSPVGGRARGPFTSIVFDPDHPSSIYAAGWRGVYRSEDDGETWRFSDLDGVSGLATDPSRPGRVWAAKRLNAWSNQTGGLFRSDDGARTFEPTTLAQGLYCLLYDRRHPGTIYAGSYDDTSYSYGDPIPRGGAVFVSHDDGETFTKVRVGQYGPQVKSIAADPFSEAVYAAVGHSVVHGPSWLPRGDPLPGAIFQILADPTRRGRLYCSTDAGLYRSSDGGLTWQPFSEGLASLHPGSLAISPDGRFLYTGTHGGGVFVRDLSAMQCVSSETRLCLAGNRYAVELFAGRRGEPASIPGTARALGNRGGYFSLPFATGDPELPEVIVKILGHGALGVNGSPVFYTSLTTLPFVLSVTDTVTGAQQTYSSDTSQPLCGEVDVAFEPGAGPAPDPQTDKSSAGDLRLLDGRFSLTLSARHPHTGAIASGHPIATGDRYGFFTLPGFTSDPTLPEVIVKMLDFRWLNGKFLFFYTGLTSADYTLTVTDSVSGATRTYESPGDYCGAVDAVR